MASERATTATPRTRRAAVVAVLALFGLALMAGGYHVGRDMAHRDNARAAIAR